MSLKTKIVNTAPLKISVAIPPENPQVTGSFIGNSKVRNKAELRALHERIQQQQLDDEQIVRELYTDFEQLENDTGVLTGEASIVEVCEGPLSAYLTPAVVQAYYAQYGEARTGNSKPSRAR